MSPAAFGAVALLSLMAAISPGPAVLMAARTGVTEGMRTGAFLAMGIGAGAVVWAAAALFGLALVFQVAPALLRALKLGGAAYLAWMAWPLLAVLNEALWNTAVARVFSLRRTRVGYLRLKGTIDRAFGGLLALLGLKIAVT